jgi:hypothetical protein
MYQAAIPVLRRAPRRAFGVASGAFLRPSRSLSKGWDSMADLARRTRSEAERSGPPSSVPAHQAAHGVLPMTATSERAMLPGIGSDDSYVARFATRLDSELAGLENPTPERRCAYLRGKLSYWTAALEKFIDTIDVPELDEPENGGPDVWQYHLILCEINTRLARIAP